MASWFGPPKIVELLLQNNASVNEKSYNGDTALIVAVKNGHRLITQLLVYNGAYINAKDRKGKTALDYTSQGYGGNFSLLTAHRDKGFWRYFLSGCELIFDRMNRIIPESFLKIF